MKSNVFGILAAGVVTGLLATGAVVAADKKAAKAHCTANECKGTVMHGAKATTNECKGKMACKGVTKEECEKDAKGTWVDGAAKK